MTYEWWEGGCEDESVFDKYSAYLESVADRLPPDVLRLHNDHTLHDSELLDLSVQPATATVVAKLEGFDIRLEDQVAYTLRYSGVDQARLATIAREAMGGPAGLGHLGYHEFELLGSGLIEHQLLFSSGALLSITFRDLQLVAKPRKGTLG